MGSRSKSQAASVAVLRNLLVEYGFDCVDNGERKGHGKKTGKPWGQIAEETMVRFGGKVAVKVQELSHAAAGTSTSNSDLRDSLGMADILHKDASGRMSKALKGQKRFNRWGKHYLRAISRSHQLQCCTSFMDPGLQRYGGELFKSLRERGDAVFLEL